MYRGSVAVVYNSITDTWDVWVDNREMEAREKKSHAVLSGKTVAKNRNKKLVIERKDGTIGKTIDYEYEAKSDRGGDPLLSGNLEDLL